MPNRSKSGSGSRLRALARGAAWPMTLMLACPTAACVHAPNFELIRYKLPETAVSAKISLTLKSCADDPSVDAEMAVVGEAAGSNAEFPLTTRQLKSSIIKRQLKLTLHDTGAIATLGSSNENRLGAIVGDAIKFAAQVVGAAAGVGPAFTPSRGDEPAAQKLPACSPEAMDALRRIEKIDARLKEWRDKAIPADPAAASAQNKAIDRLLTERSTLRAGILHADISKRLKLADLKEGPVGSSGKRTYTAQATLDLDKQDLPWLAENSPPRVFEVEWTVTPPAGVTPPSTETAQAEICRQKLAPAGKDEKSVLGVCLPRPVYVAVEAGFMAPKSGAGGGKVLATAAKTLPMPQWGVVEFLDLKGGDRDVNLSLDKFGRTSEASWTAKARAETIAAGLAGAAEQAAAFAAANSTTARQKSEIDALTTQQTLNRLRACREILAAGGSACPAEATIDQSVNGGN
ncbi:hypothetical protein [Caulobacter sp.]|uniref:hypothetical protein n=1 Tax=Caulobacter sp. TaxID=78 RepID=UPI002B4766A6|nr:hypothetical protein [Caulobacter sp.]HJV42572.1 hypothetical protein [Caulobacter sp.]